MDIFATKGIEYLLVIGYLVVFIPFWRFLRRSVPERAAVTAAPRRAPRLGGVGAWFDVPEDLHFHRGHTWARPDNGEVFRVGMDDFAQKLLGPANAVLLPAAGEHLEQGEPGWRLQIDGHTLDLLSPVGGEIVEVNEDAVRAPALMCEEPYGRGWLLKVRVGQAGTALKNLLPGRLARVWTEEAAERLSALMGSDLGVVLQDGGIPVSGFARQLAGERWHEIAVELLMAE